MTCKICLKAHKTGPFVNGSRNYHLKTLRKHTGSQQHKAAVEGQNLAATMRKATQKAWSESEGAVIAALRVRDCFNEVLLTC